MAAHNSPTRRSAITLGTCNVATQEVRAAAFRGLFRLVELSVAAAPRPFRPDLANPVDDISAAKTLLQQLQP